MLTTSRRLAWVSSLLARSPRLHAAHQHPALARSARRTTRPRRASLRGVIALLDQLGQPPLVVGASAGRPGRSRAGTSARCRPCRLSTPSRAIRSRPTRPATSQQLLVDVVTAALDRAGLDDQFAPQGRRCFVHHLVDRVVDRDPDGQLSACWTVGQHVAGELDVTEHVGDVLGVHGTRDATPSISASHSATVDTVNRPRRNGRGLESQLGQLPHRGVRLTALQPT